MQITGCKIHAVSGIAIIPAAKVQYIIIPATPSDDNYTFLNVF